MKKAIFPFLAIVLLSFYGCIGQFQKIDSFIKSNVDTCINGDTIAAFANNTTKYLNSFKTEYKDSLIDEVYIKLYGIEPSLYDTIRTESIRGVIDDSILFSGAIPFRIVHKLKLESMDVSSDKKTYSLIFNLLSGDVHYKYEYDIHIEDSIKTSSEFKILSEK